MQNIGIQMYNNTVDKYLTITNLCQIEIEFVYKEKTTRTIK